MYENHRIFETEIAGRKLVVETGKYAELAKAESSVVFGGRLGEYKYYDMDKVIESAMNKAGELGLR